MSIISVASGNSCWRGLDYYKDQRVLKLTKINDSEYESVVRGNENYHV